MDLDPELLLRRIKEREVDRQLKRISASTLSALDAVVDVEQRLRDLYRDVGLDPASLDDMLDG